MVKIFLKNTLSYRQKEILKNIVVYMMALIKYIPRTLNTIRFQARNLGQAYSKPQKTCSANEMISVIIPTLSKDKQADHLAKLKELLSVYLPNQSYKNYEALVFCDGANEMVEKMIMSIGDSRIRVYATDITTGRWGHPQTRMGIAAATGEYFVRLNDDNKPYYNYLQSLISEFDQEVGVVYGRVIYNGEARMRHSPSLGSSFVIPSDKEGVLRFQNIDCMNYMVRMDLAKKYVNYWNDSYAADWCFIEALLKDGIKTKFVDEILGEKL